MTTTSNSLRPSDFDTATFQRTLAQIVPDEAKRTSRKAWELTTIAQILAERGPITSAIGFGVGLEPLPAWLAARGVDVLATDDPAEANPDWVGQHAARLEDLADPRICQDPIFRARVTFRPVDMNALPTDLLTGQADVIWSTSTFEHLGSLDHGVSFVCDAMACLKPGGLAVHVTEYNLKDGIHTLNERNISFFRERDLRALEGLLAEQGDRLWPLCLHGDPGPAYTVELNGHHATSVCLVIERGGQ